MIKIRVIATGIIVMVLATVGLAVLGQAREDRVALLQVWFDYPPAIVYQVGSAPSVTEEPSHSPWVQPVVVSPGDLVLLMVTQGGTGETRCEIVYRGQLVAPGMGRLHGPGTITCRLKVPA